MTTQTVVLTKAQITVALTQAALTAQGIDPATPGLVTSIRFGNDLDIPQTAIHPRAIVTVTTP